MSSVPQKRMLVGLDIGTSKVVALVGEVDVDGHIELLGLGSSPSRGLKKGVVVNIESTVDSIRRAVEEAELMAGCNIHSVYVGIAGNHIHSMNSNGIVAVKDREVNHTDIERVIDAAQAVAIPQDQAILHVLPQEYVVDSQEGIKEPVGMSGVRLEAKVHLVTGSVNAIQNIERCVQRCELETDDIILEQLASSYAVLTDDEMELGVCLVDIGGGTSEIAVMSLGGLVYSKSLRVAGDAMDGAMVNYMRREYNLMIGDSTAEKIKKEIGTAIPTNNNTYAVKGRDLRSGTPKEVNITEEDTAEALNDILKEMVEGIKNALESTPPELSADLVDMGLTLTGGGALLKNIDKRFSKETGLPVHIADEPLSCVAIGTGRALDQEQTFSTMLTEY